MRRVFILFLTISSTLFASLRLLHLSFHKGCINDFNEVARELNLKVTVWNPLSSYQSLHRFLGTKAEKPVIVYNMTHERADQIWHANKDYFNQFDAIITSDTAPLSRIFLQNGWRKPLFIWVCNRFNYCVGPGSHNGMDAEYYDLFRAAMKMPNVKIISYTPFEQYFAALYGVDIRGPIIKPIGTEPNVCKNSSIPEHIDKPNTVFVWPGFPGCSKEQKEYIYNKCSSLGFNTYSGKFNGPDDLTDFKAVIYFPYQASNIALFENLQRGIVHFVPSERCIWQMIQDGEPIYYWHEPYYCEWYFGEHRDVIVYFDSWDELRDKVWRTEYRCLKPRIQIFGQYHRREMLQRWGVVFKELGIAVG